MHEVSEEVPEPEAPPTKAAASDFHTKAAAR